MEYTFIIFLLGAAERSGFRRFKGLWKKVLRIDRPDGWRVLKFDGPLGPEGCGGGFAAELKKGGAAFAAGCVEGL